MDIPQPRSKVRIQGRLSKPAESRNSIVLKQQKKAQEVVVKLEKLKIHKDESLLTGSSQATQSTMPTEESKHLESSSTSRTAVLIREDFEVFDYLIKKDQERFRDADFLARHKIIPAHRAKMIDWIVEVMHTFKCSYQSLFLSV
jgi:hypothetical protein